MKSFSFSSLSSSLCLLALGLILTGCEPDLQFSAETISPQAKNAVDVLPANPMFVGMMNTQDLKSNQYTNVFEPGSLINDDMPDEALARFKDFVDATGFDPSEDLSEVYMAIEESGSSDRPDFSVVAYASIEPERLEAYVKEQVGDKLQVRSYRGVDVYEGEDDGHAPSFSFVNDDMMIGASSASALEAMIDRLEDGGNALNSNAAMMDLVGRASSGKSGWIVAKKPAEKVNFTRSTRNDMGDAALQMWTALEYVVVAGNVESDGIESQVFLYPSASVSSDDLASLAKGMVGLMKASPEVDDKALALLDEIKVTADADYVRIGMRVDNSMLAKVKG